MGENTMGRLVVIAFLLLVFAAGGAYGLMTAGIIPNLLEDAPETVEVAEKAPEPKGPRFAYVRLKPFTVPLIADGEVKGSILYVFRLKMIEEESVGLKPIKPRIRDIILTSLLGYFDELRLTGQNTPDLLVIKKRLTADLQKNIKKVKVYDVILSNTFPQRR
jgi:flagellar basal body-associated protein FliL